MKGRIANRVSGLWFLVGLLSCASFNHVVKAAPAPMPHDLIYSDISYPDDAESILLLQRLKQMTDRKHEVMEEAREISKEQFEIQAMLEAEARSNERDFSAEYPEMLPEPSAREMLPIPSQSGKRTTFINLCHFKICNMGRKRQL